MTITLQWVWLFSENYMYLNDLQPPPGLLDSATAPHINICKYNRNAQSAHSYLRRCQTRVLVSYYGVFFIMLAVRGIPLHQGIHVRYSFLLYCTVHIT